MNRTVCLLLPVAVFSWAGPGLWYQPSAGLPAGWLCDYLTRAHVEHEYAVLTGLVPGQGPQVQRPGDRACTIGSAGNPDGPASGPDWQSCGAQAVLPGTQ
ncbi:MAG: hypothetical protein QHH07_03945 [Sedimentisphaerales bacterium]|nr:hypothetical protein [Sedimentisphaerales bacterium]